MSKAEKKLAPLSHVITMNLHAIDGNTNETHWKWITNDGEQRKSASIWTHLDLSPLSSSFSLHLSPFSSYPYMFHFRCSLSPSSCSFLALLSFCPSLFPYVGLCGVGVAGPHPSQTTAVMLPCSVQPSALRFCHSEHRIFGGWRGSPLHTGVVIPRCRRGSYEWRFSQQGGLYHVNAWEIRIIWTIFQFDRIKDGALFLTVLLKICIYIGI